MKFEGGHSEHTELFGNVTVGITVMPAVSEQGSGLLEQHKHKEDIYGGKISQKQPVWSSCSPGKKFPPSAMSAEQHLLRTVGVSHWVLVLESTTIKIKEGPNYKIMFEKLNI